MNYHFKKGKNKSLSSGVCALYCFRSICRLPGFFWHCTFNFKCFLYLLDINVLPFLIELYKPVPFYSNLKCGGYMSTGVGAANSLVLASQLLPFSWNIFNIYLKYNATFPVDNRHTAHVEKTTNGMLCLYAHYGKQNNFFQTCFEKWFKKKKTKKKHFM